ncbi:S1 family peptidase [Phycicoccus avicenniae]|uniref:S1 family peptidase n=1 Tax=Phycicoccus avicenniae TaxID=2828860 RepID=UPI003D2A202F
MKHRVLAVGVVTSAVVAAASVSAWAAPSAAPLPTPDDVVAGFVAQRDGVSTEQARQSLERKADRQRTYESLDRRGVATDGAYFDGERLVVLVDSPAAARSVQAEGLVARQGRGQSDLDAIARTAQAAAKGSSELVSLTPDLAGQTVVAEVAPDAPASLRSALARVAGVTVEEGAPLTTQADVVPGRIMDLSPGTNCSLGFPGTTSSGNNVLLTAGHCVEGLPDILDANGTHIGKGVSSRFVTGAASVDMGLMDIDAEDVGRPYVDTRGGLSGNVPVYGASKNPVGSDICKAGNTTGWTCGQVQAYNVTVNYQGGTSVSGLARATVCTEGGDSGGAYIGTNNYAQGMTSGGPVGVECGFNAGYGAGSYSFYQPVVDAASYYGVTVATS